ncbi:IST1-like protein, partial [Tetrabaena socialis]
ETTTRLCVGRIKLLRNKKTVQLKQSQRDIAELLRNGKQEYARIRVEGVIREKLLLQAYEILELYLELLTVRTQLIAKTKELPRDMMEAISSIIYAAQRINDLPELATLRTLFVTKYGKEYATEAAADATTAKWQAYEILELYLELLTVRTQLIAKTKELPRDMMEAISSIIYAAQRINDLPELATLRTLFVTKYGKEYATEAAADATTAKWQVNANLIRCLLVEAPQPEDKLFANAQQAAHAAQQAAHAAHAAAENAAQWAAMSAAPPGHPPPAAPQQGWLIQQPMVHVQQPSQGPPPPSHDSYGDLQHLAPAPPPPPPPPQQPGPHGSGGSGASIARGSGPPPPPPSHPYNDGVEGAHGPYGGGGGGGGFVHRSNEDIQRAYDAAPGPPAKEAPAAPPLDPAHLPSTPFASAAPVPPQQAEDEYEDLTRRLEALKKR